MPTHFKGYLGDAKTRLDLYKLIGDHFGVGVKRDRDHFRVGIILGSNWESFKLGIISGAVQIACGHPRKHISLSDVDRMTEYSTDL